MSDTGLPWGDAQWDRIRQVVHDEAMRARVAASFLPLFGPLPGATEIVPRNTLHLEGLGTPEGPRLAVNDHEALRFASVSVNVYLKNHMAADPDLTAAVDLFRRAAEIVARVEDAILFNGCEQGAALRGAEGIPAVYSLGGAPRYAGLLEEAGEPARIEARGDDLLGPAVFDAVAAAVLDLESRGHQKPFACVLGHELFRAVNRPIPNSMVLPRDSIPPFLDGPLLRASTLPAKAGLLVSLQGEPVEIVVPSDISVRYLQATLEGRHAFRVSQRFVLRVKDASALAAFAA